jgi:hypothetical protein
MSEGRALAMSLAPEGVNSIVAKLMFQFGLRPFQPIALGLGQGFAGAVDVECQHRKRGAVGAAFAARAMLRRALEGSSDLLRIGQFEDAALEIKRIAFPRDALRLASASVSQTLPRTFLRIFSQWMCDRSRACGLARGLPTFDHRNDSNCSEPKNNGETIRLYLPAREP